MSSNHPSERHRQVVRPTIVDTNPDRLDLVGIGRRVKERVPLEVGVTSDVLRRDLAAYVSGDRLTFFSDRANPGEPPTLVGAGIGAYLLNHHDDVVHVLQANAGNFEKTRRLTNRRGRRLTKSGVLTSTGEQHRRRRNLLAPSFRARGAARDGATAARHTDDWAASVSPGDRFDLVRVAFLLAEHAVVDSVLSNIDSERREVVIRAIRARRRFLDAVYSSAIPYEEFRWTSVVTDHRSLVARLDDLVRHEITERRSSHVAYDDLLSELLAVADREADFDDADVVDEVRMALVTGHETVADAIMWTLRLLSEHVDDQRRVAAECRALEHNGPDGATSTGVLVNAAVAESLRLFPPTWLYVRRALGPTTLPSGLSVKRGAKFYICPYVLHRNPSIFPDPDTFRIDRFVDAPRPPRGSYVPFGLGRHACLGEQYAKVVTATVVASILRRVSFAPDHEPGGETTVGITLGQDGFVVRVTDDRLVTT